MLNGKEGRLLRRNNDKDANMKINILLCDDDKDFLQRISDTVAGQPVPPGASICITKSSNPAEITDRQLSQYHIMFLDIDMDERSGMDIARRVRELQLDTVIIFVTNYPEFSMEGYEVRAFRYLLKQELEQKLPNYFRDALAELPRDDKVLRFSANAESFNIPYKDILYLESNQRVIYLYTVKPMQAPDRFYGKMEDLATELEGDGFLRIQKSYLVNMAYIKKFNYDRVVLFDGKELSVSQKRYSQMKVQYLSWKNKNWGNAAHRQQDRPLLLRSYQALVVDEAHKLPDAARQMYTESLSEREMQELCTLLRQAHYSHIAQNLRTAFRTLVLACQHSRTWKEKTVCSPFGLTPFRSKALADCIAQLQFAGCRADMPRYLRNRLGEAESTLRLFLLEVPTRILYIETDMQGQLTCCAASNRVPQLLRSALWNTGEPAILTSGTLAAAGNFDHTEQLLGLAAYKPLRHFSADSPFNYKKKCLLYLPQRRKERTDNRQLADEIVRLVHACCGHALVLFTSYRQMAEVKAMTDGRWPYPTFQAWRNGGRVIQQFKESGNGVLFAAGSCWEGIDFPGNMVSLLIIAKLPFPIPDPVSDYERQQYPNLRDYINVEIIPEMQKKLRQGFGRAIRTEQDSCVVAILDERAGIGGKYHDAALAALPSCPTTSKIEDVQQFIREQKRPDYFL